MGATDFGVHDCHESKCTTVLRIDPYIRQNKQKMGSSMAMSLKELASLLRSIPLAPFKFK